MSLITNKRDLLAAVQRIVKSNQIEMDDFNAAGEYLAQVFTDMSGGIACQITMAVDMKALEELTKEKK